MITYSEYAPTSFDPAGLGLDDRQSWLVAPVMQTRDSDALERSNFRVVLHDLGGESDTVEVHRFGHWGPGWFEIVIVAPNSEAARKAEEWESALADYPVADEMDFSEEEQEEIQDSWDNYGALDFQRALAKAFHAEGNDRAAEWIGDLSNDQLWELYRKACDDSGRYEETCSEGVSFPIEDAVQYIGADDLPPFPPMLTFDTGCPAHKVPTFGCEACIKLRDSAPLYTIVEAWNDDGSFKAAPV